MHLSLFCSFLIYFYCLCGIGFASGTSSSSKEAKSSVHSSVERIELDQLNAKFERGCKHFQNREFGKAIEIFEDTAKSGLLKAQVELGYCYRYGLGVPVCSESSAKWFMSAAEQGDSDSQNNLGEMYKEGLGLERDIELACLWFRKSADQKNSDAQVNLGRLYEVGSGVIKDKFAAAQLYAKAFTQGNNKGFIALKYLFQDWQK